MKSIYLKLAGFLALILMSFHLIAYVQEDLALASGKMEVGIGQRVELLAESASPGVEYKWVLKQDGDILKTQSTRTFSHVFEAQGEYVINLTATSGINVIESTTVFVLAGERYPRPYDPVQVDEDGEVIPEFSFLHLDLRTLPSRGVDGRLRLAGDGKVRYDLSLSAGDIIEYRIDKNIFVDSDGNGTANDDIDNASHASYLTGAPWVTEYSQDESTKVAAEVTLVDFSGKKVKEQVEIIFEEVDRTGPPVAVLTVSPPADENNLVRLYDNPHKVGFYSRLSKGNILEYRIDRNVFEDSDGDGKPANDIDNLNDASFKTGDVWETEYAQTDEQIIAQLIVVGEGGKGSRIQRGIVFGDKPAPPVPSLATPELQDLIRLISDKEIVLRGDPIQFEVKGLQQALETYNFDWDFNGDGEIDKTTEGVPFVETIFEEPGVFNVRVLITDTEGNTAERAVEVVSKDTEFTTANFDFEVEGNTLKISNRSVATTALADKTLKYDWSFGDPDEASFVEQQAQLTAENPSYQYKRAGTYLVTLTVTDADLVTDSKTVEVSIEQNLPGFDPESEAESSDADAEQKQGSFFVRLLKIFLTLVLIVIGLVLLIAGGFLVYLKVQHPDLTFEELIDELRAKLLSLMGVDELGQPTASSQGPVSSDQMSPETVIPVPEPEVKPEPKPETTSEPISSPETPKPTEPAAEPELAKETGPVPDWMKEKDVIEGEVVEESGAGSSESGVSRSEPQVPTEPIAPVEPEIPAEPIVPQDQSSQEPPQEPPVPPAPESPTPPKPDAGPTPEGPKSDDEKGPVPDWLKGV